MRGELGKEDRDLKIIEVKDRSSLLIKQLLAVWESSVRATHLFLSEDESVMNKAIHIHDASNAPALHGGGSILRQRRQSV